MYTSAITQRMGELRWIASLFHVTVFCRTSARSEKRLENRFARGVETVDQDGLIGLSGYRVLVNLQILWPRRQCLAKLSARCPCARAASAEQDPRLDVHCEYHHHNAW